MNKKSLLKKMSIVVASAAMMVTALPLTASASTGFTNGSYATNANLYEKVADLAGEVEYMPGQVISKTLAHNDAVSVTLFAFEKGEEIVTHDSIGDAMVTVLDGVGEFTVGGVKHICKAGEALVMPATIPHAVYAVERFKMLLTVVFPVNK